MNDCAKRVLRTTLLTGGLLVIGAAGAQAAEADALTESAGGVLNGTVVQAPVEVDLGSAVVVVGGEGAAGSTGGEGSDAAPSASGTSGSEGGVLNGTVVQAPVEVDLGSAVVVVGGEGAAGSTGGEGSDAAPSASGTSGSEGGVLNGTVVQAPVEVDLGSAVVVVGGEGAAGSTGGLEPTGPALPTPDATLGADTSGEVGAAAPGGVVPTRTAETTAAATVGTASTGAVGAAGQAAAMNAAAAGAFRLASTGSGAVTLLLVALTLAAAGGAVRHPAVA